MGLTARRILAADEKPLSALSVLPSGARRYESILCPNQPQLILYPTPSSTSSRPFYPSLPLTWTSEEMAAEADEHTLGQWCFSLLWPRPVGRSEETRRLVLLLWGKRTNYGRLPATEDEVVDRRQRQSRPISGCGAEIALALNSRSLPASRFPFTIALSPHDLLKVSRAIKRAKVVSACTAIKWMRVYLLRGNNTNYIRINK